MEGILIFENRELCKEMDIKIFVDTDADVRLARRIHRDVRKRGRSLDSVLDQYLTTVKPMHEQYVEPSKKNADLVVLEGGKNVVALDMIIGRIQRHIDAGARSDPAADAAKIVAPVRFPAPQGEKVSGNRKKNCNSYCK